MKRLQPYISQITKLCELHSVKILYAFGSILNDNFTSESDIDLIVDFNNMPVENYADNYFDLKFSLQELLNRPIDLLEEKALKNPYLKSTVIAQRKIVYG